MQGLGATGEHCALIDDNLPEAISGDRPERLRSRHDRLDIDVARLLDGGILLRQKLEAAFGLGLDGKPEWDRFAQRASKRKKLRSVALFQLKLDLADWRRTCAGQNFTLVKSNLDGRAAMDNAAKGPLHIHHEDRPK